MSELIKNTAFLRAVIYNMAEMMFNSEVTETLMVDEIIGAGCEYDSKEDWIQDRISEVLDATAKNVTQFKSLSSQTPPSQEAMSIAKAYYGCQLGSSFRLADGSEVKRVPGGWLYNTVNAGVLNTTFIPFDDEFRGLTENG